MLASTHRTNFPVAIFDNLLKGSAFFQCNRIHSFLYWFSVQK
ncbi:hypothetical protein M5D96_012840 [Drosophila gunungcola]|uniref:Uncharacterized protein n=1 Tax=Drosophila gunungcola TaxID=103775 RepID=A0A9P9YCA3_9MUSC|nr:hypothetical protein M5D96_012840 [Drosophila gunungcola]